jgi:methylenetetrahydrofolate reductase (NADPH)
MVSASDASPTVDKASFSLSFEFFPPKDDAGQQILHNTLQELTGFKPDFFSVTYGAGGSTSERSLKTSQLVKSSTGVPTIGHLTWVGATRDELADEIRRFEEAGLDGVLALRGDPVGGPSAAWTSKPDGFTHADELVQLVKSISSLPVGVAAFPDTHPASNGNASQDIDVLLRKEELGATFAITQFVFASDRYEELLNQLNKRGSQLAIYPGIMPVTNYMQIVRMLELSGGHMPTATRMRFYRYQNDPESLKKLGIEVAVQICEDVLALGAPGLHFYTLNHSGPSISVLNQLSMIKEL